MSIITGLGRLISSRISRRKEWVSYGNCENDYPTGHPYMDCGLPLQPDGTCLVHRDQVRSKHDVEKGD